jgi:hypothetical protein
MKKLCIIFILTASLLSGLGSVASAQGRLSGDIMTNVNFYIRDTNIGAFDNNLYDNYLSGGEAWLSLRYADNKGFAATVRFDGFQNTNLLIPTSAYTAAGIGAFNLRKEFKKLTIEGGHIYDQIGSGVLWRAYEDRGLLIDNALFGLKLKYQLTDHLKVKGFTGQIKRRGEFTRYEPIVKALNIETDFGVGEKGYNTLGVGALTRTMDQASIAGVVNSVNGLDSADRFVPKYNTHAGTIYNTLNYGAFTWFVEAAVKSNEAIAFNAEDIYTAPGTSLYSTLGFAVNKLGINAAIKRTENFVMRTSPNETALNGLYNWQPIIAQIRTQRVIARYSPQSQDVSEQAANLNVFYNPTDKLGINVSYTHINTLQDNIFTEPTKLFREAWGEVEYRGFKKFIIHVGAQYMEYNQELYQIQADAPLVYAFTPFTEVVYKIDKQHSLRMEAQYMETKQDYGSWLFGLLEYNISPKWSFAVTDMYNIKPSGINGEGREPTHYPNVFVAYTKGPHRFTGQYVKQVEGINCTGGVCRFEPAFSGFKFGMTSSF